MRAIFIVAGVVLLKQFHWIIYLFGAFLVLTGIKLALEKEKEVHPERNPVLRLFRRLMPVTERYEGGKFFLRKDGRTWATPLFVVLLVVETTDLVFAVDSIPAILAITHDPFIVYTSNVFAILGLRALYFALAGIMQLFHHLHYGLAAILVFVGVKMLVADFYKIPIGIALGVVAGILTLSILASLAFKPAGTPAHPAHKSRRFRPMPFSQVWMWPALVAAILGVAAVASIRGGPDARHAATAIRLAQQDVAKARAAYGGSKALQEAEAELSRSTAALKQRRYEESMAAAIRARQLAQSSLK
jgi:predicted tellurium resistance membrane protein TerC